MTETQERPLLTVALKRVSLREAVKAVTAKLIEEKSEEIVGIRPAIAKIEDEARAAIRTKLEPLATTLTDRFANLSKDWDKLVKKYPNLGLKSFSPRIDREDKALKLNAYLSLEIETPIPAELQAERDALWEQARVTTRELQNRRQTLDSEIRDLEENANQYAADLVYQELQKTEDGRALLANLKGIVQHRLSNGG